MRKYAIVALAVLLLIAGCAKEESVIKIGFVGPFTGSAAQFGVMMQNGLDLALQELPPEMRSRIQIIKEDDKCKSVDAVTAVKKLIEVDNVNYVIGPLCNEATIATENSFEYNKVISLTIGLPSDKIANMGQYHFSFSPEIEYLMKTVAKRMVSLNFTRVAVIHMDATFEKENYNQFSKHFTAFGGQIVADEAADKGSTDFRTIITKVKSSRPDALMLIAHTAELNNLLKQLKEQDLDKLPKFGIHAAETPSLLEVRDLAEGLIYPYPAAQDESEFSRVFAHKYSAVFSKTADPYSANTYDSLRILVQAIEKCGHENKDCVAQEIASLQNYEGANGLLTLDERGVGTYRNIMLKTVKNGAFQKIPE